MLVLWAMTHSNSAILPLSLNKSTVMFGLLPSEKIGIGIDERAFGRGKAVGMHTRRTRYPSASERTANVVYVGIDTGYHLED